MTNDDKHADDNDTECDEDYEAGTAAADEDEAQTASERVDPPRPSGPARRVE